MQDPANELPFGHVDMPVNGAQVGMLSGIGGWAIDDRGVRELRLYVDGHIVNTTRIMIARPDVSRAYPRYARPGDLFGWSMLLGFDSPGPHDVVVQAVDSDGATRDIGALTVTALDK